MKLTDLTPTQRRALKLLSQAHPEPGRLGSGTDLDDEGRVRLHGRTARWLIGAQLAKVSLSGQVRLTARGRDLALYGRARP